MSNWVHTVGAISLSASVYSFDEREISNPEEQIKIGPPEAINNELYFNVYLYSLPRVKSFIGSVISAVMPQGETGFYYSLAQNPKDFNSSSSQLDFYDDEVLCYQLIKDKYFSISSQEPSFNESKNKIHINSVSSVNGFLLSFDNDLCYTYGKELLGAFEVLFDILDLNGISINKCSIQWIDDDEQNIYRIASDNLNVSFGSLLFEVINRETSTLIARKEVTTKFKNGKFQKNIKTTDNWDSFSDAKEIKQLDIVKKLLKKQKGQ